MNLAQVRPDSRFDVQVWKVVGTTLVGMPVIGNDFSPILVFEGVEVGCRSDLPGAMFAFRSYNAISKKGR